MESHKCAYFNLDYRSLLFLRFYTRKCVYCFFAIINCDFTVQLGMQGRNSHVRGLEFGTTWKIVFSNMINVRLNIHLMYVSGQLFLINDDLEYISKAYVHDASGKYKMSYDFWKKRSRDLIPWLSNIEDQCAKLHKKVVPFIKLVYMNESSQIPNVIDRCCSVSTRVFVIL